MRPGRVNLTLLLLIVVIGGLIYLMEHRRVAVRDGQHTDFPLLTIAPDEVDFLRLEFNDQIIELKREAGQWNVVLPFRDRASEELISRILESWRLLSTSVVEGMMAGQDAGDVGLSSSEKRIIVGSKTARRSISVGKSLPVEGGTYVSVDGDQAIYLAMGNPFESIPEGLNTFRQKVLFSGLLEDVKRFEIRGGEQSTQCVREDSGDWIVLQPFNGRGDGISIQSFLEALYELRVARFVADQVSDPGIYSIDERSPEIRLYYKGEAKADIIQLGSEAKESGEVYASDPSRSSVFTVSENIAELLKADAALFRDRRPVPYPGSDILGIRIRYAEADIQLEQTNTHHWIVRSPEPRPASKERVDAFIDLWTSPVIREFVAPDNAPAHETDSAIIGELEFTAGAEEGELDRTWTIRLYEATQPGRKLIHLVHDDAWATVPSALLEDRAARALAFYSLQILNVEKSSMVGFTLESSSATQKVVKTESGNFESETGQVDRDQIRLLSRTVGSLNAAAAVAESLEVSPPEYFSADTDVLTVHVSGSAGISRKLLLGKRTPSGSRYVKLLGDPVIYLISKDTASLLIQNLVLRQAPTDD